jgi:hypothetical protein
MEILFRGKNMKGEWVEGSLVTTTSFIKQRPQQHTKHWIVQSAFGNGGWFCVQRRQYVKTDTLQQKVLNYWIPVEAVASQELSRKHQDLLVCSFRYALGRRTGIVLSVVEYLTEDWDGLKEWQQKQIKDDILHAIEHGCAGDDCDIDNWKQILNLK